MATFFLAASILSGSLQGVVAAAASVHPQPAIIYPSNQWFGIDGNWSAVDIMLGNKGSHHFVYVSTTLAEIWAVDAGGCLRTDATCASYRGNTFDFAASSDQFKSIGRWQLGLDYLDLGGDAEFGTMSVAESKDMSLMTKDTLVAAIQNPNFFLGFFGLGITAGQFGAVSTVSPIEQCVSGAQGATSYPIPSRSYGFTAGAFYAAGGTGVPASLTLGGYDANRFASHGVNFNFNQTRRLPEVLVRGVTANVKSSGDKPANWTSNEEPLLTMNDTVFALIDSSTPFLWLPPAVCDRFAAALGLVWNTTYELYTFQDSATYRKYAAGSPLSLIFTLSSFDNRDDFGRPLEIPGAVNITVPLVAFAHTLRYPYMNLFSSNFDSAVPYFPLKRSVKNQYILGRAFMQEAYMIMKYEDATFSVHQAKFPSDPTNRDIVTINRPPNSPYSAPPDISDSITDLKREQLVGIIVGALLLGALVFVGYFCCWRRRRRRRQKQEDEERKECGSEHGTEQASEPPMTRTERIMAILTLRSRSSRRRQRDASKEESGPVEVGADKDHQVFELEAPLEPVELDNNDDTLSINGTTELGTEETHNMTAYEVARRKLERQLQGPVPEYTPPSPGHEPMPEKGDHEVLSAAAAAAAATEGTRRSGEDPSPVSSPTYGGTFPSNVFPISPVSPRDGWAHGRLPSPVTTTNGTHHHYSPTSTAPVSQFGRSNSSAGASPTTFNPSTLSRSSSSRVSPQSPSGSLGANFPPPSPVYQRAPIDPSRVVCLGPLPDNVALLAQRGRAAGGAGTNTVPRLTMPGMSSGGVYANNSPSHASRASTDTLGSNFTVEEAERAEQVVAARQEEGEDEPTPTDSSTARRRQLRLERQERQRQMQQRRQEQAVARGLGTSTSPIERLAREVAAAGPMDGSDADESPRSATRIDTGLELVHVPQLAERRYSWEEGGTR